MQIKGLRASYGDSKGAHDLLRASSEIETVAVNLTTFTDNARQPPPQLIWQPFFRGFAFEGYYAFIKTFPDPTASRSGMVFSEALFYPLDEAVNVSILTTFLAPFSSTVQEGKQRQIGEYSSSITEAEPRSLEIEPPGLITLCNDLIENETGKSLVWLGQYGFVEVITALWSLMIPSLRKSFSFRFCFVPQDFGARRPTIIYTPSELAGRWVEYQRISPTTDITRPKNEAAAFLLGRKEGESVREFLFNLEIESLDWQSLRLCDECVNYLHKLSSDIITISEFKGLISRISVLVPDENQGSEYKKEIFEQFCQKLTDGCFEDLFALNNLNIEPFSGSAHMLNITVTDWLTSHLLELSASEARKILTRAKDPRTKNWGQAVSSSLKVIPERWSKKTAEILWQWWQADDEMFDMLQNHLPQLNEASKILCETCPRTLPDKLSSKVSAFALQEKQWQLHAAVAVAYQSPLEAIEQQLKIEPSTVTPEKSGLIILFKRVPVETILKAALHSEDIRLLPSLAGRMITNPQLLAQLDIKQVVWQKLFQLILEKDSDTFWRNAPNQQRIVFDILDLKLAGSLSEPRLLSFAAQSPFTNILKYPERKSIWDYLSGEEQERFLTDTANAWWSMFISNPQIETIEYPETQLKQYILTEQKIKQTIEYIDNPIDVLLRIFSFFRELNQYGFERLLNFALNKTQRVNQVTAIELGKFIRERRWKGCANDLLSHVDRNKRGDLLVALEQCADMFNWFENLLSSTLSNLRPVPLRWEDWWNAFAEFLIETYQDGPNQSKLWKRAGGDVSILLKHATGRDAWLHAIQKLRDGGGGEAISTLRIIEEVKKEYRHNEKLELLERLFRDLGGRY